MKRANKISVTIIAISAFVLFTAAASEQWSGFVFRGGKSANPEEGGPFKTKEECFSWAKAKIWRQGDEYRCGSGCAKDALGNFTCSNFETAENASDKNGKASADDKNKQTAQSPKTDKTVEVQKGRVLVS